jgi:hypothetical protein
MITLESLKSLKFQKLAEYEIVDTSRIFGGQYANDSTTQIQQSDGMHWDKIDSTGTNFYSDGGEIMSSPSGNVTTSYIPAYVTTWVNG